MATTPVGYNPSQTPISGTTQIGNLAIGTTDQDYSSRPGGITYWMSPEETLGYVIAKPVPSGLQPFQPTISATAAYVGFSRSALLTEASFVSLANQIAAGATSWGPSQGQEAKTWLEDNGYWTSFVGYPSSLLVYLDSGNSSSYSGSGSTWTDLTTPSNNATLINSPTYSSSNGGIIQFDDVSLEYATIPNIGNLSQWTVETWVRITGSLSSKVSAVVCNQFDLSTKLNFSIGTNNAPANRNIAVGFYNGAWRTTAGFAPTLNTWYQIVGTYDGSTIRQYVNGVANGGTLSYSGTPQSGGEVRLMRRWDESLSAGNFIDGDLSIVKIYNEAISSEDVLSSYNQTKTRFDLYDIQSFTSVGTTSWTAPAGVTSVEYLVVGGGGGGGNGYDNAGGGGGGGGMVRSGTLSVTPGQTYSVTVGGGGTGGANTRTNNAGSAGGSSIFATITSLGGGQGLGSRTGGNAGSAQDGIVSAPSGGAGSGGGAGGKGGGGAGGTGSVNSGTTGGGGGAGISSSISGSPVTYGSGGGGGNAGTQNAGVNGTDNTGNGGRAGGAASANSTGGGNGGSGIVIIKY